MYKTILLPVDLNRLDEQKDALQKAVAIAHVNEAALHVAGVLPDYGMSIVGSFFPEGFEHKMLQEAEKRLTDWCAKSLPKDLEVHHHVFKGTIYEEILQAAQRLGVDLIVMTAHRPELKDYLLGPNAARVVRHADCSVLVVRA
jgi:nucleotide-binding universal stress UspA family protein